MSKCQDEIGRTNWATSVKNLLFNFGFGYVCVYRDVDNVDDILQLYKDRLICCNTQTWSGSLFDSSRCETYRMYKSLLEPEKYLSLKILFYYRKAFAKFICSNHKFLMRKVLT